MSIQLEDHLDEIFEILKLHLLPLFLIFVVLLTKKHVKPTNYESFCFYWFLFNGAIIHITWDAVVGGLH